MRRLLPLALALAACSTEQVLNEPDVELNRMIDQPRYDPYGRSTFFEDGRVMQPPPRGTVSRDAVVGEPRLTFGYAEGVYTDRIPLPLSRELLADGREQFEVYCAPCHGVLGDGDSVVASNMKFRRPPSLHASRIVEYPVGRLYQVIHEGYGYMPSYSAQLSVEQRWAVVAYVLALQRAMNVPVEELPPEVRRRLEEETR